MAVVSRKRGTINDRTRFNVVLAGPYNDINREFYLPETAVHDPPTLPVRVRHGGRHLLPNEFTMEETIPGNGFDKLTTVFAPQRESKLVVDYTAF